MNVKIVNIQTPKKLRFMESVHNWKLDFTLLSTTPTLFDYQ